MNQADRNRIQEFLQIHHAETFGMDWLSRHLSIPFPDVEQHCNVLILEGYVARPEHTQYVCGVEVDWKAVHEGRVPRPEWNESNASH